VARPAEQDYPLIAALASQMYDSALCVEYRAILAEINRWRVDDALEEEAYGGQD